MLHFKSCYRCDQIQILQQFAFKTEDCETPIRIMVEDGIDQNKQHCPLPFLV